jgi:GTP-binding protein Era
MPRRTKPKTSHKFGYVAIAGRPNAGKSTLLNALLGAKLAIVSAKPQTTRGSIMGVLTAAQGQAVFLDTPGIHKSDTLINRRMMQSVRAALEGKDLLLYVVDVKTIPESGEIPPEEIQALDALRRAREAHPCPAFLVLNKVDLIDDKRLLLPRLEALAKLYPFDELIPVSAQGKDGLEGLRRAIFARLPEGEARFAEDFLTDMPERQIVAEIIRERILHLTGEEVPHSVAVVIEKWEDKPNIAHVAASIIVEKEGQKAILIGARGAMIKRIGTEARRDIEEFLGRRFFLELFVKVKPKWRENEAFLNELGWQNTSEVI